MHLVGHRGEHGATEIADVQVVTHRGVRAEHPDGIAAEHGVGEDGHCAETPFRTLARAVYGGGANRGERVAEHLGVCLEDSLGHCLRPAVCRRGGRMLADRRDATAGADQNHALDTGQASSEGDVRGGDERVSHLARVVVPRATRVTRPGGVHERLNPRLDQVGSQLVGVRKVVDDLVRSGLAGALDRDHAMPVASQGGHHMVSDEPPCSGDRNSEAPNSHEQWAFPRRGRVVGRAETPGSRRRMRPAYVDTVPRGSSDPTLIAFMGQMDSE